MAQNGGPQFGACLLLSEISSRGDLRKQAGADLLNFGVFGPFSCIFRGTPTKRPNLANFGGGGVGVPESAVQLTFVL